MRLPGSGLWLFLLLTLASLGVAPSGSAQEVVADYSWAQEHRDECADQLLGAHESVVDTPFSNMTVATVRVVENGCGERQVSLVEMPGGTVRVHVGQVIGEPILEQLYSLHEANPDQNAQWLCGKIPTEAEVIEDDAEDRLRRSLQQLHGEGFSLLPETLAVVHGVTYSIWITTGQWEVQVYFSDTRDPKTRHRLATWAEELVTAAGLACRGKPPGHGEQAQ